MSQVLGPVQATHRLGQLAAWRACRHRHAATALERRLRDDVECGDPGTQALRRTRADAGAAQRRAALGRSRTNAEGSRSVHGVDREMARCVVVRSEANTSELQSLIRHSYADV